MNKKTVDKLFRSEEFDNMFSVSSTGAFNHLYDRISDYVVEHQPKNDNIYRVEETDDGNNKVIVNVLGHDEKSLDINLLEDEIQVKAKKPEDSNSFVKDIDLKFSISKDYDGTKTSGEVKNGILTLIIEKKEGKKPKQLKL